MAWHRPGGKPLSEPIMVTLLTHICVTRPQWVKKRKNAELFYQYHKEFPNPCVSRVNTYLLQLVGGRASHWQMGVNWCDNTPRHQRNLPCFITIFCCTYWDISGNCCRPQWYLQTTNYAAVKTYHWQWFTNLWCAISTHWSLRKVAVISKV